MFTLDAWFRGLLELAVVSFLVLGVGALVTWRLKQPVERLRAIQWTFAALIAALVRTNRRSAAAYFALVACNGSDCRCPQMNRLHSLPTNSSVLM